MFNKRFEMDASKLGVSCCQRCRHFTLMGRRGGTCGQLNVTVRGNWSACPLAAPVFTDPVSAVVQPPMAMWPQGIILNHLDFELSESECLQESA